MDKKYVMAGLLIIISIAIVFLSVKEQKCDWRHPNKDYGPCSAILGYYYDGTECMALGGCGLGGDKVPFKTIEECKVQCEK